jgi:membrane associated rhomboid family serine protease
MSDFRSYRPNAFPPIVKNLIIINALVFLAQVVLDARFGITEKIQLYPFMPEQLREILMQLGHPIYSKGQKFEPYQIATHMFTHGGFTHLLFNMITLWMFGRILENVWGAKRFLLFYLACGVGAAVCHLAIQYFRCEQLLHAILNDNPNWQNMIGATAPAVGASGAIMGVVAAFAYLFPNTELFIMFIPFPVKAKWAMLGWFAIDLFGGVANISGDNIAHFAHLGGAITGFILVLIWNKTDRKRFF